MEKPDALRLADWLEDQYDPTYNQEQAAAELRRLSAVEAQRDALLEALKYHQEQTRPIQRTLDVIKAVEGEKNHG